MEQDQEMEVQDVAEAGRGGDTVMAHLSLGELVIPRAFLDDPEVMQVMKALFEQAGANINQYIVGDPANSINPETGYAEFGFFKSIGKIFKTVLPIAASFIPGIGPLGAAAIGAGSGLLGGGGLKSALLGGALGYAGGGGLKDTILGRGIDSLKSGVADTVIGRGISDVFKTASGALDNIGGGVDKLYQGSDLQSAFKSGGDALKSIGIDTASAASVPTPSLGGGASSYSNSGGGSYLPKDLNGFTQTGANTYAAPTTIGATQVASSSNYLTPALSALLGTNANNKAAKALLAGQRANQDLLAPYTSGFSFTPGDLTQDPGYQFNLEEGTKATDRAQLARGGYFSGNALKEAQTFGQGLADNTYGSAFNRALQGRQASLTGALAGAGVNENIGNIKANSATNSGNLLSGALGSILPGNSFTNTGALQGGMDIQALLRRLGIGNSAYAGA